MNFLNDILSCKSVAGNTAQMQSLLKAHFTGRFDGVKEDVFGSSIFTFKCGDGKKLMLCTGIETAGAVVCYADKSKISLSPLGNAVWASLAYSSFSLENVSGVLIPPHGCNEGTSLCDFTLETYDEKAEEKVILGESGFVNEEPKLMESGICCGFGAGVKACIYSLCAITDKLLEKGGELLKEFGIGELCVAFIGQESLVSRGSSGASYDFDPNYVINIAPYNVDEKNTGAFGLDDGVLIKMLDKGFVADEKVVESVEKLFERFETKTKRCVSNSARSSLVRLTLGKNEEGSAELCLPVKYSGTRGETVKILF